MPQTTSKKPAPGTERVPQRRSHRTVVLGAGLAGLTAAAALAPRAEHVTVVDRDALPRSAEPRAGVPQGRHIHLLVPGGRAALERILPGVTENLRLAGAQVLERPEDFAIHVGGGRLLVRSLHPDFVLIGATRPTIEGVVRERVRALPNVEIREGLEARGLLASGRSRAVTGVRVRSKEAPSSEESVAADLVVDATGRGSRAPRWLEELGYDAPREEAVRIDVRYTTRMFRRAPGRPRRPRNVMIGAAPGEGRGGVAQAVEGDRWIVTLHGMLGEQPPGELGAFRDYARSLWSGDIHDITAREAPIGEALSYALPSNARRRYDRLRRFPEGFAVVGDALSSFNPTYGQGMSVAALEAEALAHALERRGPTRIAAAFHGAARRIVDDAWTQAVDNDLLHPGVEGSRGPRWRLVGAYMGRLVAAAHHDPVVARAFFDVMGMRASGPSLLRPALAARVLLGRGPASSRARAPAAP